MSNIQQIRQRLDTILAFMQPHWEFVNCHMVDYLTHKHWLRFVPLELQREVSSVEQIKDCIETLFWQNEENQANAFPAFTKFLNDSRAHRLDNYKDVLTTIEELQSLIPINQERNALSIKEFMSAKKQHEVEITADLINQLVQHKAQFNEEELIVVDAGDGKGYLSSRLALQYKHKVLGIDANTMNTENAIERNKKLQKYWNGLTERAELQNKGIIPPRRGRKPIKSKENETKKIIALDNYKTISQFITTDLNLAQLVHQFYETTKLNVCLTGLHTCGNLASTCLQVFHAQPECKILCNIGCCYHLLKEAYSGQEFFGSKALQTTTSETGFPLSQYLQQRRFTLGRMARMLAAQSIERTVTAKELPNISIFYRALLEVLIRQRDETNLKETLQVGKIRKFNNFQEYVQLCATKFPTATVLNELESNEIDNVETIHNVDRHYLDLFYLLRMSFAPVLESIILLDRLLYLKECGHEKSYLISLFDAVISPRHYAIIALKD